MDIKSFIWISFVCAMGAISPGPSLVLVLRNTISGGRKLGIMTGIGHGLGFSIYAFITVMGLSSLILANEQIFHILQFVGALVFIWLAFNMIIQKHSSSQKEHIDSGQRGFLEGFMIAFLNPKILAFLVAVFSQFINLDITNSDRIIMVAIAGIIDTTWYVFVAVILTGTSIIDKLKDNAVFIDRLIGIGLLALAILLILKTFGLGLS